MVIILNIILFLSIAYIAYVLVEMIINAKLNEKISKYIQIKNEKYYKDLVKYYNKSQKVKIVTKINIIYKINILIDKSGLKRGLVLNPISIIIFSLLCFLCAFFVAYMLLKILLLAIVVSLPCIFIPVFALELISEYNSKKLEIIMLDFLLQIKNYTKINNDIVYAFKQVKTAEPLQGYINTFLIELNSGIKFEKAIDNIKEKIGFESMRMVFSNIQYCYLYGGDFSELMDKSYKMIYKIQKEKVSRIQETKNARIVLRHFDLLRFVNLF